jgi:glycosyltransferase involved in cell wall biosynthesis
MDIPLTDRSWSSGLSSDDRRADTPLVSVVLMTHDRPQWLSTAVRSVLDGTFQDLELIVSNNGDPACTRDIAQQIDDERVNWCEFERDSEMIDHLRSAVGRARGRYLAILHDDDWWHSSFLAALVPALQANDEAVMAFTDHYVVNGDGFLDAQASDHCSERFGRAALTTGYYQPFFDIAAQQGAPVTGSLFRRGAIDFAEIDAEMNYVSDVWIVYLHARTGGAAYYHDERLLYSRAHEGSATSSRFVPLYLGTIECRERLIADSNMADFREELCAMLARDHLSAAGAYLRLHRRNDARRHLRESLGIRPGIKAAGGFAASLLAPNALLDRI